LIKFVYARPGKASDNMIHIDMTFTGYRNEQVVYSQRQIAMNNKMWSRLSFPNTVIDTLRIPVGVEFDNLMIIYDSELVDGNGLENEMDQIIKNVLDNMMVENNRFKDDNL
jgi:hypothetical protein